MKCRVMVKKYGYATIEGDTEEEIRKKQAKCGMENLTGLKETGRTQK